MSNVILYRDDSSWKYESESAQKYFKCIKSRMEIKAGDLVIPRYSALPFYKEQEHDINYVGAKMINTYHQHLYVADLQNWVEDLKDITPQTWSRCVDLPDDGPFILKGETNSKKHYWKELMFAENKTKAIEIAGKLSSDSMLQYQNIYIRKYVKLKTYIVGLQDLPITKEFRFFFYKDILLSGGYYWSSHSEELKDMGIYPDFNEVPISFLNKIAEKVKDNINFWVVDVAQTEDNEWIVIELNDGSQSGLSDNDPDILYKNLALHVQ